MVLMHLLWMLMPRAVMTCSEVEVFVDEPTSDILAAEEYGRRIREEASESHNAPRPGKPCWRLFHRPEWRRRVRLLAWGDHSELANSAAATCDRPYVAWYIESLTMHLMVV